MRTRILFLLVIVPFLGFLMQPGTEPKAAEPAFQKPPTEYECRWADGPITIDGKADEEAWKDAQVVDRFYLPWLKDKARDAKSKTKARLLWDREYLYFLAEMEDTDLYADVKEQDGMTWSNDVFELFFKPAVDKGGYYEFQVNAAGTKMDMFLPRRGTGGYQRYKGDGPFHIESKVALKGTLNKWTDKDEGWTVEGRIPWTDFMKTGGRPNIEEKWKFALCRYDYSVEFEGPELSTCAPLSIRDFHTHEDYATLKFVGPAADSRKPHGIVKREPLTTSTVKGSPEPPMPYRTERVYPKLNITLPIAVTHIPGTDQLFFISQEKRVGDCLIQRMKDDPKTDKAEDVLDLKGTAYDITFHPKFKENGYVYVGWNGAGEDKKKYCRVTRWTMQRKAPYTLDPKSEKLIIEWASDGHNGAAICFGRDGMLYITSGDGTSDSDTNVTGQSTDTLLSKMLRIDVDHPDKDREYSVPKDNPYVNVKEWRPETWAVGFRNPWRITCDAKTGHIWVGNNGQDIWEQVYFVRKGDNYGWSVYEGSHPFYLERKLAPAPHTMPALEHHHSEARSLTGGIVYYGKKYPDLVGAYIYGDYSTGRIWAAKHDGTKIIWHKEIAQSRLQISGFGTDSTGEILICDHDKKDAGAIYTLVPTPKDAPKTDFPKTLSASGLFTSVKGHQMQPGMIPYSVNAQLWSDGAHKARWIGLPGPDAKIEFTRGKPWGFPEQTVLVKSFALEREEGKPETRRWIETRFFTKQDKEWYGYSYIWNEDQTEGTLVESKGIDREYTIKTKDGERKQKWHYPSRSECMVCHSRAAQYVLGLNEMQMNKEHDYGHCTDHQFRVLERMEVFQINYKQFLNEITKDQLEKKNVPAKEITARLALLAAAKDQREPVKSNLFPFNPEKFNTIPDPYDPKADLDKRARAYLHVNCANCHINAGGGNSQFDVEWRTTTEKLKLVDAKPVHHTYNLPDARLVAPGHPERSLLLHRISHREAGAMPPLASAIVDKRAVDLIREWIQKMPETPEKKEEPPKSKPKDN